MWYLCILFNHLNSRKSNKNGLKKNRKILYIIIMDLVEEQIKKDTSNVLGIGIDVKLIDEKEITQNDKTILDIYLKQELELN